MTQRNAQIVLLIAIAIVVLFTNLGSARLWDRDEPRNAGCAREMMERGDWVTPMFNDELREQKPVLLYWLIMSAYSVFGVSEFAARFWSAALAVATVLMTYSMGRRLHSHQAGFWSALALATCLMFVVAGRAATPDSVLIFCCTAALTFFVHGTFANPESLTRSSAGERDADTQSLRESGNWRLKHGKPFPQQWPFVVGMYSCMALGVLAKGPVGLVLPTAVIGMFGLLIRLPQQKDSPANQLGWVARSIRSIYRTFAPKHFIATVWSMRPFTAIALVLLIAAPWYVWVGLRTEGDFLAGFFLKEHFGRATTSFENHSGPIYYYPMAMLVGFFPWSIFALPTLLMWDRSMSGTQDSGQERSVGRLSLVFLACWVGVYVGVFTIAQTKLPSYVTPCYPALALATGIYLADARWLRVPTMVFWTRGAFATMTLVGVGLAIALPLVAREYLPGLEWLGALGIVIMIGGILGFWMAWKDQWSQARLAFGTAAVLFTATLFGLGTVWADRHQESNILLSAIDEHRSTVTPDLASVGVLESSWVYYSHRPIFEIDLQNSTEAESASSDPFQRTKFWAPKVRPELHEFLQASEDPFLITRASEWAWLQDQLPDDFEVLARANYFLKNEELVVIGRPSGSDADVASKPDRTFR